MSNKNMPVGYQELNIVGRITASLSNWRFPEDDFRHYQVRWKHVSGWLTQTQAQWLFEAAKLTKPDGKIVEIGSAYGRSTVCLAWGAKQSNNGHVYAVDPHYGGKGFRDNLGNLTETYTSLDLFKANIRRFELEDWIEPIVATSEDAVQQWDNQPIRLLFVDGWHTYNAVKHDILKWSKFVVPNGCIALHDYQVDEIRDAIHDSMDILGIPISRLNVIEQQFCYFYLDDKPANTHLKMDTQSAKNPHA
jgi:Methyltransferase domain